MLPVLHLCRNIGIPCWKELRSGDACRDLELFAEEIWGFDDGTGGEWVNREEKSLASEEIATAEVAEETVLVLKAMFNEKFGE